MEAKVFKDEQSVYAVGSWYAKDCPCPIAAVSEASEYATEDDIASELGISTDELNTLVMLYDIMGAEWLSGDYDTASDTVKTLPADVAKGLVITAIELCAAGEIN